MDKDKFNELVSKDEWIEIAYHYYLEKRSKEFTELKEEEFVPLFVEFLNKFNGMFPFHLQKTINMENIKNKVIDHFNTKFA